MLFMMNDAVHYLCVADLDLCPQSLGLDVLMK